MSIIVDLDVQLARRKMPVGEFVAAVNISAANISVLKNGRAKAIRFSTLDAICQVLDCQPGDILRWIPDKEDDVSPPDREETRRGRPVPAATLPPAA